MSIGKGCFMCTLLNRSYICLVVSNKKDNLFTLTCSKQNYIKNSKTWILKIKACINIFIYILFSQRRKNETNKQSLIVQVSGAFWIYALLTRKLKVTNLSVHTSQLWKKSHDKNSLKSLVSMKEKHPMDGS